MPSKQDVEKNIFPSEVEDLVAAINHNLQLKCRPPCIGPVCCSNKQQKRVAPYVVPMRLVCRTKQNSPDHSTDSCCCKYCLLKSKSSSSDCKKENEDPYEMLQDLLKEGSLIKEAVKRLQLGSNHEKPRKTNYYELDEVDLKSPSLFEI